MMGGIVRGAFMAGSMALALAAATPAGALTYLVVAQGAGKSTGYSGPSPTPVETLFSALQIQFTVPDTMGSSSAMVMASRGLGFLDADTSGVRMSFSGSTGVGAELFSGNACTPTASGVLPTAPVSLTPDCGAVTYSAQGKNRFDQFAGKVISFNVIQDGYAGSGLFSATIANVPEPASWMMMIAGFGLAGALQRRYRVKRYSQAPLPR